MFLLAVLVLLASVFHCFLVLARMVGRGTTLDTGRISDESNACFLDVNYKRIAWECDEAEQIAARAWVWPASKRVCALATVPLEHRILDHDVQHVCLNCLVHLA